METNKAYSAPAILEETVLEVEAGILAASHVGQDVDFDDVQAMGQELGDEIDFSHRW